MRRNVIWFGFQVVLRVFFSIWLRYRARGHEQFVDGTGALLLINHQSFLDPLMVGLPLKRPVSFLARENLFRVPFVGWILKKTHVIPINRDAAGTTSIRATLQSMRDGFLTGIFPEGTRSGDGRVARFRPGFIALVRRGRVPVYPVGVAGSGDAMPRGAVLLRPSRVRVVFGRPFTTEEIAELTQRGQEDRFAAVARDRVAACVVEAEAWRQS